jgi:hypothetical protein
MGEEGQTEFRSVVAKLTQLVNTADQTFALKPKLLDMEKPLNKI